MIDLSGRRRALLDTVKSIQNRMRDLTQELAELGDTLLREDAALDQACSDNDAHAMRAIERRIDTLDEDEQALKTDLDSNDRALIVVLKALDDLPI